MTKELIIFLILIIIALFLMYYAWGKVSNKPDTDNLTNNEQTKDKDDYIK